MSVLISNLCHAFSEKENTQSTFHLSISTSLPNSGLVCILGKSGCGKSTLLHILGLLEKSKSGSIKIDNKEITKYSKKQREKYLNETISFVFQNYQLLEDKSIAFNIALPYMISGQNEKKSLKKSYELLQKIGFSKDKFGQLAGQCSGGEKQRIAVLRSIINEPQIILADEPTGALDSKNSKLVMDLLKEYSSKALVVVVTHNNDLANEYADRIITMSDGRIISDISKSENKVKNPTKKEGKILKKNSWINRFINDNLKRRFKRNFISGFGICFSLIFTFIIFGFSNGATAEIERQSLRQFDIGTSTISIQKTIEIEGSKLSLVQQSRLSSHELLNFVTQNDIFCSGLNYSYLVPNYPQVKYENQVMQEYSFNPVYSFKGSYCPKLLVEGRLPKDSLNEVVINTKLRDDFVKTFRKTPLNLEFRVNATRDITTYFDDEANPYISDYFNFEENVKVVGVVDEVNFLSSPKIFYSYVALDEYIENYIMNNISSYLGTQITFKDKIDQCLPNDEISSFSYMLFLKDFSEFSTLENIGEIDYEISNGTLVIKEALESFISATTMGMEIFLLITALYSFLDYRFIRYTLKKLELYYTNNGSNFLFYHH